MAGQPPSRWATSDRRQRLPKDWPTRRAAVKRRANGLCQAKHHEPECNGYGSECDHIDAGDNHELTNLQWLSSPCHRAKTLREAQAGRRQTSTKRTPPRSPGVA